MSFGRIYGRPKISSRSLESEFRPVNSTSIGADGAFNAGVYVVRRKPDNRKCVEKRFMVEDILNGRARFEMFALRELAHKNVVEYLHAFVEEHGPAPRASLYMEYADLGTLDDNIRSLREEHEYPPASAVWYLALEMANAVSYLQYGIRDAGGSGLDRQSQPGWIAIVHRDIKPANIFLRTDSDEQYLRAILGDFGQAIRKDNDNWDRALRGGDRMWSPPEYPTSFYAGDWWSVGAITQAFARLGGQYLSGGGQRVVGAGHRYSHGLSEVIFALMRPCPDDRLDIRTFAREAAIAKDRAVERERAGNARREHQYCRRYGF